MLIVPADRLRELLAADPVLGDLIVRAYLLRRSLLIELGVGHKVVGSCHSPDTRRLRDFLAHNRIPHEWIDLEEDELAERVLLALEVPPDETPIVICRGEISPQPDERRAGDRSRAPGDDPERRPSLTWS